MLTLLSNVPQIQNFVAAPQGPVDDIADYLNAADNTIKYQARKAINKAFTAKVL